jgi:hypothetical protein
MYRNGYISYRQGLFTNLENTLSFLTLAAKIKQYNMRIITEIIMKWLCPNDQSPFETL